MRIKITKGGIFGANGEIPVGTELDVADWPETKEDGSDNGAHPWAGRFETISGSRKGKVTVANEPPVVVTPAEALALSGGQFMTFKAAAKKALGDGAPEKKEELIDALVEKLSHTELKTYLGSKNVEVKDETRDELVALAKAA